MLGLKKTLNLLVDYDPLWETAFIEEHKRLSHALGEIAKGIEHYGSTAVPGMRAKPILDILVGVRPFDEWAKCRVPLEPLGYDYAANAGVLGHHIFDAVGIRQSELTWFMLSNSSERNGAAISRCEMRSVGTRACERNI